MANTLPLPVRIAAGLLSTGLDRLRHLPQDLPALSVTVAGQAVRASMRVQQEVAVLAGRGDELLSGITSRPTEHPNWARFDEEDGDVDATGASTVDGTDRASDETGASDGTDTPDTFDATVGGPADPVEPVTASTPTDSPDMPGYLDLRLAQVRARIRRLDAAAVGRLLEYEQAGPARAAFLTLLANRLTTLESGAPEEHQA